jgi:hypothetical protein
MIYGFRVNEAGCASRVPERGERLGHGATARRRETQPQVTARKADHRG